MSVVVAFEPVIVAKARANLFDCGAHRLLKLSKGKVDGFCSTRVSGCALLGRLHRRRIDEAAGLASPQRRIVPILRKQIAMRALRDDAALVEHNEAIHLRYSR